jgi:hypothetical protein
MVERDISPPVFQRKNYPGPQNSKDYGVEKITPAKKNRLPDIERFIKLIKNQKVLNEGFRNL